MFTSLLSFILSILLVSFSVETSGITLMGQQYYRILTVNRSDGFIATYSCMNTSDFYSCPCDSVRTKVGFSDVNNIIRSALEAQEGQECCDHPFQEIRIETPFWKLEKTVPGDIVNDSFVCYTVNKAE